MANINNTVQSGLLSKVQDLSKYGGATKKLSTISPPKTTVLSPVQNLAQYTPSKTSGLMQPVAKPVSSVASSSPSSLMQQAQGLQNTLNTSVASGQIPTAKTSVQAPQQSALTYPGLIKSVVDASSPNKTQTNLLQNLQETAQGNQAIGNKAQEISDIYAPEINRIGQLGAGAVAGNLSTGTNVVGSGNANLAANAVSSRIQALQNAQNAQLKGTEQQLAAQGQTANAYNQALGGANTQQGQQISGLGTAAGFAQPVQVPYSNQFVNPMTGEMIGGGGVDSSLSNAVQSVAQQVQSGVMSYDQGVQALSGYGQGGMNALQQALGGGFSPLQSNAQGAANAAATLQTGTMGGELTKQADTVVQHMQTLKSAYQNLTAQFGVPAINQGINWFKGKIGDGELQSYKIALTNVRDELAKILGGGTSTDGTRATAESLLPDNMSPAQIESAVRTATELMTSKIAEYTKAPQYGNQSQGGVGGLVQTSAGAINTDW